MFDIGWTELVLIGIVALIVIGPKDLPDLFRTLGRFTGRMRGMARDFQRAMDAAADESGVRDVARDVNNLANPAQTGLNKLKDAATKFENWDPLKPGPGPAKPAEVAATGAVPDPAAPPAAPTIHRQGIAAKAAEAQRLAKAEAQAPAENPTPKPRKPKAVAETAAEPKPKAPRKPKAPKGEA